MESGDFKAGTICPNGGKGKLTVKAGKRDIGPLLGLIEVTRVQLKTSARTVALLIGAALSLSVSCGGDETAPRRTPESGGKAGLDGGADASPTGGAGGSGGTAGATTGGGGTIAPDGAPKVVMCNGEQCVAPPTDGFNIEACCWNDKYCGLQVHDSGFVKDTCIPLRVPGTLNPDCPGLEVERNAVQRYGCCLENGTCGAFGTPEGAADLGCVDPAALGQLPGPPCDASKTCSTDGAACEVDRDCCPLPRGTLCAKFSDSTGTCTDRCYGDGGCASNCCRFMPELGLGACAPAELCNGEACAQKDEVCWLQQDCCDGLVCAQQFGGLYLCSPPCGTTACSRTDVCVTTDDAEGAKFCAHAGTVECSNTCATANDGTCDDGGKKAAGHACPYGSDCADCGPRAGAVETCRDTCSTAGNGTCDDGGPSSKNATCPLGSDCKDCGPRREVCTEVCEGHENGVCEDGSARSTASTCALGTDCIDCRLRVTYM